MKPHYLLTLSLLSSAPVIADSVVLDDQIIIGNANGNGSLCVGPSCADGEEFDFDTVRLKAQDPQIHFQDTSSSASFPSNDWRMGVNSNSEQDSASFFIENSSVGEKVLIIDAGVNGGIALGADSELVDGAVSVGSEGAERIISHVASGVTDTDAVNKAQLDASLEDVEEQIDDIVSRLEVIEQRLNNL